MGPLNRERSHFCDVKNVLHAGFFKRRRWTDVFPGRSLFMLTFSNTIVHLAQKGLLCHNAGQSLASYAGAVSPMMHGICITLLGWEGVGRVGGHCPRSRRWQEIKESGSALWTDLELRSARRKRGVKVYLEICVFSLSLFEKFSTVTCPWSYC